MKRAPAVLEVRRVRGLGPAQEEAIVDLVEAPTRTSGATARPTRSADLGSGRDRCPRSGSGQASRPGEGLFGRRRRSDRSRSRREAPADCAGWIRRGRRHGADPSPVDDDPRAGGGQTVGGGDAPNGALRVGDREARERDHDRSHRQARDLGTERRIRLHGPAARKEELRARHCSKPEEEPIRGPSLALRRLPHFAEPNRSAHLAPRIRRTDGGVEIQVWRAGEAPAAGSRPDSRFAREAGVTFASGGRPHRRSDPGSAR